MTFIKITTGIDQIAAYLHVTKALIVSTRQVLPVRACVCVNKEHRKQLMPVLNSEVLKNFI